ncbi:MAG: transketolase [Pelagibacteraceae bacterium]|nr:transketolase [Pelagibacteraceae bacterium]MBO6481101.1 transketolase [Pelagibacteraceae bacterium]MBO6482358.1 transketolase [Pelagibacteraceae bacterium]MBO6483088.1 transketolase [Pelagibacteraceae bacterium]MBO6485161.1 transketolase [Pelagibacteraceae bacterium]
MDPKLKDLSNAIRFLSIDAVQKANSGHPGMPMGMADVATVLFKYYLRFNPKNPSWINRDRFILSAGHGSMLLYSLLYLTGYKKIKLDDIKNFRQLNSICAGHPEYEKDSGIETTTGPLGQGLTNSVGMAIAQEVLKKKFGSDLINNKTYVVASDGDLMEGISHEAMSLAGHLNLKNLIVFFDNNKISIDGPTSLSVSDNYKKRFESYGWSFQEINGHNYKQIFNAIKKAAKSKKPSIISCKTIIGFGSPNKSGKASSHGSPLGDDEIKLVRKKLKWKHEPFEIPEELMDSWREIGGKGEKLEEKWNNILGKKNTKIKEEYERLIKGELPVDLDKILGDEKLKFFQTKPKMATRQCSSSVINSISDALPELIGGSADLSGSNNTKTEGSKVITSKNFSGNYIHYGVREHAMAGVMNGLALYGCLIPFGGTFLIFSDYLKPSMRLSALMKLRVIYIFSHDSIGLGEDGPTHQPIEQLEHLRSIPNLNVFRPADINETLECWEIALKSKSNPSAIALSRQKLPYVSEHSSGKNMCSKGAYVLKKTSDNADISLIASGSEVEIALEAQEKLKGLSINSKVISVPCYDLFQNQTENYKDEILGKDTLKISIEASSQSGWKSLVGKDGVTLGLSTFGKSAPYKDIYKLFNLTSDEIVKIAKAKVKK